MSVPAQDYPDDVQPTRGEFDVRMRYELASDGGVSRCVVTQSSRQPSLDAASCRILRERARLRSARGAAQGEIRFHWLGEASRASGAERGAPLLIGMPHRMSSEQFRAAISEDRGHGNARVEVEVSEDGAPLNCTVSQSSAAALARWMCAWLAGEARFIPASDGAGGRGRGVYRLRVAWD